MENWIVAVDDEAFSLTSVKQILSEENMKVSCLRSGSNLLKFMEKNSPDLLLLDIMMPEMDGFETYEKLRALEDSLGKSHIPVIFLTAENDSEVEQKGLMAGASDFVKKPFNREILLQRIHNTIANSKTIESLTEEATLDKLTGFLNKASGTKRAAKLCQEKDGMVMILDLDSFKLVNDLYGHEMGDKVLRAFAKIAAQNITGQDLVSRIGGDEFMAFVEHAGKKDVELLAGKLNERLRQEAVLLMGEDFDIPLGVSVGGACVSDEMRDYDTLFSYADQALYTVKQNGKHGGRVYEKSADLVIANEVDPEKELARIEKIFDERNESDGALFLGQDAFTYVYRYIVRFQKRYGGDALKLLFILSGLPEQKPEELADAAESFSRLIQSNFRRSDVIMQSKTNEFFLFLPELSKENATKVIKRVLSDWEALPEHGDVKVTYVMKSV